MKLGLIPRPHGLKNYKEDRVRPTSLFSLCLLLRRPSALTALLRKLTLRVLLPFLWLRSVQMLPGSGEQLQGYQRREGFLALLHQNPAQHFVFGGFLGPTPEQWQAVFRQQCLGGSGVQSGGGSLMGVGIKP